MTQARTPDGTSAAISTDVKVLYRPRGGHMEHDCSSTQLDAEGEVAVARLVMDGGDLPHALHHLADAFAFDPRLPDTHEALAEFVARAGGAEHALKYFDDDEQQFTGTIAARAHICAFAGRWAEAIEMLLAVAAFEPDRPWLDVAWLRRPDLPDLVDPQAIAMVVGKMAQRLADPVSEDEREPLMPALSLLRSAVARHPGHPMLLWCGSMLARRLGAFDEAVAWTERSFEIEPSHQAAVMRGYALRAAGRTEEALVVWQQEIERTPEDLDLYVDVADLLAAVGRPTEGLEWAERVIAREPQHGRAVSTAHGLRYAVDHDVRHLVVLADKVRDQPDSYAATVLANHSSGNPWLGHLPQGKEALINVLHNALPEVEPSPDLELSLSLSALEVPSAFLTVRSVFPKATVNVDAVPDPDIRIAPRDVQHVVWQYDGTNAHPAVPPPAEEVAEAVRRVAAIRWLSPIGAYDGAVLLSGLDPRDLVSVLVHPPSPADDEVGLALGRHAPDLWVRAVQTWACLGIAHHAPDEPWLSSRRREILADLLNGVEDWVNEAAAFALVVTAWVDPQARGDVQHLVVQRTLDLIQADREREVTILWSMCRLTLLIPGLRTQFAALVGDVLRQLEAG